ncbi:sensor histidine kinase [Sphingomonas lutea]|uniref:Sensor histidine kinase n=1 Tax=Sphingomonas lutea TaxID=1045317 RepID=A0A7G9SEZ3_9SPHN|nr:sensor histidine kinase [Sphingomonas lutea]QNN66418.1 sensor histidine kinase [Sphingomonas lutea]
MTNKLEQRHHWTFCVAALGLWLSYGWPVWKEFSAGGTIRDVTVSPYFFIPFAVMGLAVLAAMTMKLRTNVHWALLSVQLAAVVAMTVIVPWAGISSFLVVIAWQVGMLTTPGKALSWIAFQNLAIIGTLAQSLNPDLCWVLTKSGALQLLFVFTAQALRREAEASRELTQANRELKAAQAIIANNVRDAERLRISRELHDAWGHELTALGLQLEIASNVAEPERANDHVLQAKGLARTLLGKVRDVVATLREAERCDLKTSLDALAKTVPTPTIHVAIAAGVQVDPEQAHALIRCAQEAVTNAVRHAQAENLWLQVTSDGDGVRLVARNDGQVRPKTTAPGSGLLGMRERLEGLGGKLAVRPGPDVGFTIDAWLPKRTPQLA